MTTRERKERHSARKPVVVYRDGKKEREEELILRRKEGRETQMPSKTISDAEP